MSPVKFISVSLSHRNLRNSPVLSVEYICLMPHNNQYTSWPRTYRPYMYKNMASIITVASVGHSVTFYTSRTTEEAQGSGYASLFLKQQNFIEIRKWIHIYCSSKYISITHVNHSPRFICNCSFLFPMTTLPYTYILTKPIRMVRHNFESMNIYQ